MAGARACTKYLDISSLNRLLVSYTPLASELLDKKQAKRCYRCSTDQPKQCYRAYLGRQTSHRSKMYISAVTIAEFLIVVVIIMSLPKLVTS